LGRTGSTVLSSLPQMQRTRTSPDFRPFGTYLAGGGFGDNTRTSPNMVAGTTTMLFRPAGTSRREHLLLALITPSPRRWDFAEHPSSAALCLTPTNTAHDYGILSLDRTHIFNSSYQIDLGNLGKHLRNGNIPNWGNTVIDLFTNGWTIAGITTLQSGPDLASFGRTLASIIFRARQRKSGYPGNARHFVAAYSYLRSKKEPSSAPVCEWQLALALPRKRSDGHSSKWVVPAALY